MKLRLALWLALVCGGLGGHLPADTKLLRFPDIQGDQIVFCYGGDLWRVGVAGGHATRLTTHPGLEVFPKFSPAGNQVAFTGQYDGDEQVYVIDAAGGVPEQLTFYPARGPLPDRWGFDNQVYGWSVDGEAVLFRSTRYGWGLTDTRLFLAPAAGGLPHPLPMRVSGGGDFSPDGKHMVFSPLTRDFRTWKRYAGGWAQDLYIVDQETKTCHKITDNPRSDRDPMWIGNRIYFASDRTGTLNLFYYDTDTKETHQVTESTTFDVRWPSKGGNQIVYEYGGELRVLDTATHESRPIRITVPTDALATRTRRIDASDFIEDVSLGPDGQRALFVARGDIFSAPIEHGPVRNLTQTSGAHDKWASWSPDGAHVAYISDADGEEEIYVVDALGKEPARQLTEGGAAMRYEPLWSPDNNHLAFSDKDGHLYVVDVESGETQHVAHDTEGAIRDYTWSPDSQYLTFTLDNPNDMGSICVWSLGDGQLHRVTDDVFDDYSPSWDADGKYLYYLSDRTFAPEIGTREWNFIANRQTGIFALALRADVPHPFPPRSDEVKGSVPEEEEEDAEQEEDEKEDADDEEAEEEEGNEGVEEGEEGEGGEGEEKTGEDGEKKEEDEFQKFSIDFAGLADRVSRVPVDADNYRGLSAVKGHLLYARGGSFYYGRQSDRSTDLHIFSLEKRKEDTLAERISGYSLSADGKYVLVRARGSYQRIQVGMGKPESKTISTSRLFVTVDPRAEWRQIFHEVWRRFRDFFYVENMHGYDWDALRERYEPLLDHVAHRSDLNYVIGEMIAELNVGHAYKVGGDFDRPTRPDVALAGAIFELDRQAQRYRIAKIYPGHNQEPLYRSPLTEVGVDAQAGDYVLAIDGEEVTAASNPYQLLRFRSGHPVTLTLNAAPDMEGARDVSFVPVRSESDLVYLDMVLTNYHKVLAASDGKVGYMHLPDMGASGIREFGKWFYPQARKQGLVIDVRSNGGGNVSQMILERLNRKLLATGMPRTDETTNTYPATVFHGHLVCLLDEDSASDGDIFPAMFRESGLGPLIGKRSWGGVIGITNRGTLIDGGTVNVPEFGFASRDGEWIIEGTGVDPDIEVENDPQSLMEGRDPQLERAMKEVLAKINREPRQLPDRAAAPVRTPRAIP